jgi:hypothetical protein
MTFLVWVGNLVFTEAVLVNHKHQALNDTTNPILFKILKI